MVDKAFQTNKPPVQFFRQVQFIKKRVQVGNHLGKKKGIRQVSQQIYAGLQANLGMYLRSNFYTFWQHCAIQDIMG